MNRCGERSDIRRHQTSPLRPVHRCTNQSSKITAPNSFPILTIAHTCFACGFVFEYEDNREAMERYFKETGRPRPPRHFVMTHGVAHQTPEDKDFDTQEEELAQLVRRRIEPEKIAHILNLPLAYVQAHVRLTKHERRGKKPKEYVQ
jgi:hypothetical protein